jgi:hypothetical protein
MSCGTALFEDMSFSFIYAARSARSDLKDTRSSATRSFRLLPCREVTALVELVVMDQFGISPLRPAPRGWIEFVREDAHGNGMETPLALKYPSLPNSPNRDGRQKAPCSSTR